MAHWPEITQKM